jgi:hypothetical protein
MERFKTLLSAVLYECETWSLIQRRRMRMTENRVLRKILELRRDDVIKDWRKFHYKEIYDLYPLHKIVKTIKSRRIKMRQEFNAHEEINSC